MPKKKSGILARAKRLMEQDIKKKPKKKPVSAARQKRKDADIAYRDLLHRSSRSEMHKRAKERFASDIKDVKKQLDRYINMDPASLSSERRKQVSARIRSLRRTLDRYRKIKKQGGPSPEYIF